MITIPGYELQAKVYEGRKTAVYRGQQVGTFKPVMIKILRDEHPALEDLVHLRREYLVPQTIDHPGIIQPYELKPHRNGFALILEDIQGQSLSTWLTAGTFSLRDKLWVAIALTHTLGHLHQAGIIHKDIKPSNIIVNPQAGLVKLTDFGLASQLSLEASTLRNPNLIEGTLAYLSPEQTGRMNRAIDYRSDFYSLGVTLYELFTGRLPFTTRDPMEMVHAHIAQLPTPPDRVAEVTQTLSQIILKLLAKNAEDRYQSAQGLTFDLETCLNHLESSGQIPVLAIAQRDRGQQLLIPQKLYGREQEVATLLAAFERTRAGSVELMLVAGYSGIGKTSIVHEVHKPITAARGYFTAGKFDQLQRDVPYSALIQALQALVRQLLTENESALMSWRQRLQAALGINAQVVIDVIPDVELIIGPQPEVPVLGSMESQNRFNRVFQQFVRVFCQPDHPLVLFLDDLQWVDAASLKLLQLLVTDDSNQHLLVIGAYRDNEVSPTHPLMQTLAKLQDEQAILQTLTVGPLPLADVSQLIRETLVGNRDPQPLQLLIELLFNKTQGNPFFLTQLLKALYNEQLLVYDVAGDRWQWDLSEIQAVGITDYSIVELLAHNIGKLPEATQAALKLAACVGNQFSLDVLAIVSHTNDHEMATQLWPALQAGLILPLSTAYKVPLAFSATESPLAQVRDVKVDYKFLHDRVQQAAYSLIPPDQQQITHWQIGQLLLKSIPLEERKNYIFALVHQLNFATELLSDPAERQELAQLNLVAGQKAKASAAYEAAVTYLQTGQHLLNADGWQTDYSFTFTLSFELAEAQYLCANLEAAIALCETSVDYTQTTLDQVKFLELRLKIYLAHGQIQAVIKLGLEVLEMLEVNLIETRPENLDLEALANLPRMTNPHKLAAMEVINLIYGPACFGESRLALPLLYTMLELSQQYGNSPPAIYAYALHGVLSGWIIPDIDLAYQMGELALTVLHKLDARDVQSKALLTVSINITFKKKPIRETIEPLAEAIKSALEVGDVEFACHSAQFYCDHLFFVGEHLDTVGENQANYIHFIQKFGQQHPLYLNKICAQAVANLRNSQEIQPQLIGEIFDETEVLPHFLELNNLISIFSVYFFKCLLNYYFEDVSAAVENARLTMQYAGFVQSEIIYTRANFFYSLALLAQYDPGQATGEQQSADLEQVATNQTLMQYWAQHAPANFQHQYDLVEAELARVRGQVPQAMEYYDRAIAAARDQAFLSEEALACELAGRFYLGLGRREIAQMYLVKAQYGYLRWGALAKVKSLEARYADLLTTTVGDRPPLVNPMSTLSTTSSNANTLDFRTMMKAAQILADEIILDRLVQKVITLVIENAGAQRGILALKHDRVLLIEAEGLADAADTVVLQSTPLDNSPSLARSVVNYVVRTGESVVLNSTSADAQFLNDPYIREHQPRSILCAPLLYQGQVSGVIYLENNLTLEAFSHDHVEVVKLLCSQAAIYLKNAQLYANQEKYAHQLEDRVAERTRALAEVNQELQRLVRVDGLTQIANRRYFDEYLAQVWQRSLRESQPIALLLCDVDYFKLYNDFYGHQQGDDCLRQVARLMQQAVKRSTDLVARYGGEEFVIVLPNTDAEGAEAIAQLVQTAIHEAQMPHEASKISAYITLSLGVASFIPTKSQKPEDLIQAADAALYQAKQEGRDRIRVNGL